MDQDAVQRQPLDQQLGFALYVCSKEIVQSYKPHLQPFDLTYTQYITMQVLWENERITFKELGEKLYLDSGTLTPLVKRLEKRGLLRRVPNSEDERSNVIELMPEGRRLREAIPPLTDKILENCDCTHEQAASLQKQLKELLSHIHR